MVFHDYDPSGIATAEIRRQSMTACWIIRRKRLARPAYTAATTTRSEQTDLYRCFPDDSSYDFMVDETVPFYPIALHGYVPYSFSEAIYGR